MLTILQEKLAQAHGLAISAATVTTKVEARIEDLLLVHELERMRREAGEIRGRCLQVEEGFGTQLATELLARANATAEQGGDLLGAWFKADTGPLEAWFFLTMCEAAEAAAWSVVKTLADRAPHPELRRLAAWALELQERHLRVALGGTATLAAPLDPGAPLG
jgi:hypothetical protein